MGKIQAPLTPAPNPRPRPKRRFPFDCLDFNAVTLHNGLSNILQYVQSHLRRPGDVTVDEALHAIEKMVKDTMFTAEEELEGVPKDDLGDAITRSMKHNGTRDI